jgi:integrase
MENHMATNLTFKFVENLKVPGRYTDALVKGLHLWVKANLTKYWIFRFSCNGKQHNISLGAYPRVTIADARIKAQRARDELDKGSNPLTQRKEAQLKDRAEKPNGIKTFREFSLECLQKKRLEWTNTKHADQWLYTLEEFAFPVIGHLPVNQVTMEHILAILTPIWTTRTETASRLRGRLEWILAAATTLRLREGSNPASWRGHLQTILPAPKKITKVKHFKALPYQEIPELLGKLNDLCSIGALALEFTILNASRSGEVFGGLRSEVNGDIWTIPAMRMKAKKEHRVPLCPRALEILNVARAMDPESNYLFSRKGKPLSGMTMAMVLRRLGIDATVHGFRSGFRDWASEETNHSSEVIEMALAHTISNRVEAAYRRKDLLEKRRTLLLDWERYCLDRPLHNIIEFKAA